MNIDNYFQYSVSADVYSLSIIIFELFSGINPFPGHIGQIFKAKMSDKKAAIPPNFPLLLIEPILSGWSRVPSERPPIEEFKSALMEMLTEEEKDEFRRAIENNQSLVKTLSIERVGQNGILKPDCSRRIENSTNEVSGNLDFLPNFVILPIFWQI